MGAVLLTVSLSGPNASALGHLLHKHPDRVQSFLLPVGEATVFYPESSAERVTAALLLEVDPVGMVKRRLKSREGVALTDYVTDRPYAASSMLAVALGRVFNTALNGRSDAFPELAASPLLLTIRVPVVPVRPMYGDDDPLAGAELVRSLFEPLGWEVNAVEVPFGPDGAWGVAPYVDLSLAGSVRLADALSHLYVLLPVLDNAKHYWVGSDEVAKLVRRGEGWLADHPLRELIVRRYLVSRRDYVEDATLRLTALDDVPVEEDGADEDASTPLKVQRLETVLGVVHEVGARRVVDLGCGEGYYLRALLADPSITEVVGVDVSPRVLAKAERRLGLDRLSDHQRAKITLRQSSVTYRDDQLAGFDAILLVEVVEHLEPDRVASLEAGVFEAARPRHVIVTTPNRDYNPVFGLAEGVLRHSDHRFEWTRTEFAAWAEGVASRNGYRVEFRDVGAPDPSAGPPTQLALFTRRDR